MKLHTIAAATLALSPALLADEVATYELVWDAFWGADSHPGAYPGNGHFAPIHGTAHNADAIFWEPGGIATQGMEDMAEKGQGGALELEIDVEEANGNALGYFKFAGIAFKDMPAVRVHEITLTEEFSQLTIVSMLAPSPDWYIGSSGVDLRPGGEWLDELVIPGYVWDSGTDAGTEFTSRNEDITPHIPITSMIGVHPFYDLGPVSTWTLTLLDVVDVCPADCNDDGQHNVLDFVCFQQEWQNQTETGDCNGDGAYNVLDFVCFQSLFIKACE